jgi:hypothetical protein
MCNDNAEQYNLMGLSWLRKNCCCRMCEVTKKDMNYTATAFGGNLRCGKTARALIERAAPVWKKKLLRKRGEGYVRTTALEKKVLGGLIHVLSTTYKCHITTNKHITNAYKCLQIQYFKLQICHKFLQVLTNTVSTITKLLRMLRNTLLQVTNMLQMLTNFLPSLTKMLQILFLRTKRT